MSALLDRIDNAERQLWELRRELDELRTLAAAQPAEPAAAPPQPPAVQPAAIRPPAAAPVPPLHEPVRPHVRPGAPTPAPPVPKPAAARGRAPRGRGDWAGTADELAGALRKLDLVGARGLALVGGVVTLLGIGFFFVLATNRGWIGPGERVVLGALASALVFAGGLVVRRRYGALLAALAAVGVGIAGWYTTLAAATVRYELLSAPIALGFAVAIAAAALAVALAWSSEVLAGLGLLGAALSPALLALDEGVSPAGTAFAAVILGAIVAVSVARRWPWLLGAGATAVGAQALWTAAESPDASAGAVAVVAVVAALLLVAAVAWNPAARALDGLSSALVAGATSLVLGAGWLLLPNPDDRGLALLAAGAAVGVFCAAAARRSADLAWSLGAVALLLAAVGTADLASGATLAAVWALQSLAASALLERTSERRFLLAACGYAALAVGHVLAVDAPLVPDLYPELSAGWTGALALALAGGSVLGLARLKPAPGKSERVGALATVDDAVADLVSAWPRLRLPLATTGALLVAGAAGLALVELAPLSGHVVATFLLAAAGAAAVAAGARRNALAPQVGGFLAVGLMFAKAGSWDWEHLGDGRAAVALLVSSAALLGAGYAARALSDSARRLGWVYGPSALLAFAGASGAIGDLVGNGRVVGVVLLPVAGAYAVLAALAYGRERLRDLATTMWVFALAALLIAEAFVIQGRGIAVAFAATAVGLGGIAKLLADRRLAAGAWAVLGGTTVVTLAGYTTPDHLTRASAEPGASLWMLAACAVGWFALAALDDGRLRALLAGIGAALTIYAVSLGILDIAVRVSGAALETDFQRGHTAVSALWGAIGLALLAVGLVRDRRPLRIAGVAVLAVALGKLFLYDLSELSSVTRAVSFLAVGLALLAGGALVQRLTERGSGGPRPA